MEGFDGFEAPGLAALPLGFGPGDGFPIWRQDQPCPGIGQLDPVARRFPDIEEERALDGMLVRAGFDMDPVFEEDVGGAQDVLALVGGIGDVMEAPVATAMFLGAGQIIGLVIDGEPAAAQPAVVEPDLLGNP
ncbi:hypothetical protein D3C71_1820230 [compost metagenome]